MEAPDVHFRFPGTSSWATDVVGRDNVEEWLNRMVATGLQHEAAEVVVAGPPWRMTMVLRVPIDSRRQMGRWSMRTAT